MYQFRVVARSIVLLIMLAVYVSGAYALGPDDASLEINSNPVIGGDLHQDGTKPKSAITDNPPESQLSDLNADGMLDFITTHSRLGGVSIALGLRNGKFDQPMHYLKGNGSLTVRIRDHNNDDTLDLVAYNYRHKTIAVLFGDGNDSFTEQTPYRMNLDSAVLQYGQNNPSPASLASVSAVTPKNAKASAVAGIAAIKQSIHQQINAYRASIGLPALALNAAISKVARTHSQNMASGKVPFSHKGFNARVRTLSKKMKFRSAGENVAFNFGQSDPATVAVNGWLESPGHLNNIIGNFNLTGIGVVRNSKGEYYFTQIFWRK